MSELAAAKPFHASTMSRSFLFYGPGGSGKSFLAIKHPGKRKLYLDIDERLPELFGQMSEAERASITIWSPNVLLGDKEIQITKVDPTRKNVYAGTKIASKPEGYHKIVTVVNELLEMAYKGDFPFDCVIADSLTRIVDHLVYLVMYEHGVSLMQTTLYGVEGRNLKEFITGFLRLPCDRIMIAHSMHKEKRDDATGALIYERIRPHIFGSDSMREEIQTMFSEVYHFLGRRSDGKYEIQTATDRLAPARTARSLKFEQEIDPKLIYS